MTFVWNDEETKFIGPKEDWDKNEFVVVRKIFVELNESNERKDEDVKELIEEALYKKFKRYGPIESIQIFTHRDNTNKKFAYIQYFRNKDACLAILDMEKQKKLLVKSAYSVIPADTWHQPESQTIEQDVVDETEDVEMKSGDSTTINDLNEDCLIPIFEFCDDQSIVNLAEVNKLFKSILHQHIFPKHKKLTFNFDRGHNYRERTDMNLGKMRRYLHCFGPYLREVTFKFHYNDKPPCLLRILNKFVQYAGSDLKKMSVDQLVLEEIHVNELKPILKQLEYLSLEGDHGDYELDIDYRSLCPNLKTFKLLHFLQFEHCAEEPWPSLENVAIMKTQYMELDPLCTFIRNNPQLKRLKFTAFSSDILIQLIGQYLINLEKLTAYQGYPDITANILVHLINLKKLNTLKLMYLDETDLNGILEVLPKLSALQKLKLHLFSDYGGDDPQFSPNQRLVIALAQELSELKIFHIAFVHLDENTVVDFIRYAEKLEELSMHSCDVSLTEKLINSIVDVRSHLRSVQTKPLQLIVDPFLDSFPEKLIEEPEIQKYVRVKTCNSCPMVCD